MLVFWYAVLKHFESLIVIHTLFTKKWLLIGNHKILAGTAAALNWSF